MSQSPAALERECRTFTRLLANAPPSGYLLEKYVSAHQASRAFDVHGGFDAWLVRVAPAAPFVARCADAYARHFAPRSTLRRKLILTLALVETTPPFDRSVAASAAQSTLAAVGGLAAAGILGVLAALVGIATFGPVHLLSRFGRARP